MSVQATHFEKSLGVKSFARAFDEPLLGSSRAVATSYKVLTLNPNFDRRPFSLGAWSEDPKMSILSTGVEPEDNLETQNAHFIDRDRTREPFGNQED